MFITTQNEILSVMPASRWDKPEQLFGWLEEEERVALEPLLGTPLYEHLCMEYVRLVDTYGDITATTVRPTGKSKVDARLAHADVTERLELIRQGRYRETYVAPADGDKDVPDRDMAAIRLIRVCQQIEFYRMLAHKAGLLTVSFNEGGGMNMVTADGYDTADDKRMERVVRDAFMSAGRATDSLLLLLEADAKGARQFAELWQQADAYYLHLDLLFQTARVLNEYLDIRGERMAYVQLVRDIRFCQNTYLRPRIGDRLLRAVVAFANTAPSEHRERLSIHDGECRLKAEEGVEYRSAGQVRTYTADGSELKVTVEDDPRLDPRGSVRQVAVADDGIRIRVDDDETVEAGCDYAAYGELLSLLRTALAFFVESRRAELAPARDKLARRDSMTDAQQAMAMACQFVEDNLSRLGRAAEGSPIYNAVRERERQAAQTAEAAGRRMCRREGGQGSRRLFTGFPATRRGPELK